ncbi:cytochrome c oxidase assembly protein [Thalassoroseus pseudoceratinae]|uniref:cytochrome c oxidase assembly protein n=1 Tax=Thalassoroseus pseudoceratinae TaxID=2713176 RepID=UPI001423753C|nr:cytochrome c oxidase assembly protein [Thalassoroseus pseudoceratinae]
MSRCIPNQSLGKALGFAIWLLFGVPTTARADVGGDIPPEQALETWNTDPVLLLNLLVIVWLYRRGELDQLGRTNQFPTKMLHQRLAFAGGVLAIVLALVTPLDVLSEQLVSGHMLQHLLLMMVAAPLFVLGASARMMFFGLPRFWRRRINWWRRYRFGRQLSAASKNPLFAWSVQALILWLWHLPRFYEVALTHLAIHDLQHLSFFLSALLFWRVLLDLDRRRRLSWGASVIYLFTTLLHTMALGVFMALSPQVWYPAYEQRSLAWGLTPLEDQQIAGFLMWMPGAMMYGLVGAILLAYRLQQPRFESQGV